MARVKIEGIIDHLSHDMKRALEAAIDEVAPSSNIDRDDLYRAFKRAVYRKCSTWEKVPDRYIEP